MDHHLHNESTLLLRIAEGDQAAFKMLFDHYQGYVYTVAFRLTRSVSLSEEIVQDVFLKIWLKRGVLSEIMFFPAFLYKVSENVIYPSLRRLYREDRQRRLMVQNVPQNNNSDNDTETAFLLKQYDNVLNEAIRRLPLKQQTTFILIKMQGLKREQVAAQLLVSPETVKSNLDQAMRSIRAYCLAHMELSPCLLILYLTL